MQVGERIKEIRRILNLTQAQFGEKLDFKWTKVRDLEKEKLVVSPLIALQIEKIYFINLRWLLYGEGEMFIHKSEDALQADDPDETVKAILALLKEMPDEKKKECLSYCQEKKLLSDLLQEKLNKPAG
ncbi:MAG: helix-turn-helix domain-containing protein [bacterium]